MDNNGVIGKNGDLPWSLPNDLKNFRKMTIGSWILMGRKTHESIGRLLPGRDTIILTRDYHYRANGALTAQSLDGAIQGLDELGVSHIFIIGGGQVYKEAMQYADTLYVTEVDTVIESGDAFFPSIDRDIWAVDSAQKHSADDKHKFNYRFVKYSRI